MKSDGVKGRRGDTVMSDRVKGRRGDGVIKMTEILIERTRVAVMREQENDVTYLRVTPSPLLPVFFLVLLLALTIAAQTGSSTTQQGVTPPRGTFVIRNARIVTVSGPDIENGSIVIRDGKIEAVGATVNAPAGALAINGVGLSVYPGMIDA